MKTGLYTGKSDEELVTMYNENRNEDVFEELLRRTEKLRYKLAINYLNIPGSEVDDLLSEGMLVMYKSISRFDASKKVAYTTFLFSAISRQYNTMFKGATCGFRSPGGFVDSLERLEYGDEEKIGTAKGCLEFSVDCEDLGMVEIRDVIERTELSQSERVSVDLLSRGFTKPEIAKVLGVATPSVHSYISRAGKKLSLCGLYA